MRIERIEIQNFRSIEHADLKLQPGTCLLGENGAGKSSLLNAIQMAVFGFCQHTTKAGAGFAALIRDGAKTAEVTLHTDAAIIRMTLGKQRTYSYCTPDGEEMPGVTCPSDLLRRLGISEAEALLCLYSADVVGGPEFSGVLSDYLSAAVTVEALQADPQAPKLATVQEYHDHGQACYDKRTAVKRDLKIAEAVIEETGFLKPVTLFGQRVTDADVVRRQYATQTELLDQLRIQRGRAEQAAEQAPIDREALTAELAALEAELATAEEYVAALADYRRAKAEQDTVWEKYSTAQVAVQRAKDDINAVADICPTCERKLTKALRDKLTETARGIYAEREAERDQLKAELDAAVDAVPEQPDTTGLPVVGVIIPRIADIKAQLAHTPTSYTGPTLDTIAADIATATAEQQACQQALHELDQHARLEDAKRQAVAMAAEVARLDWLVEQYHSGAAFKRLIAPAAGQLMQAISDATGLTAELIAKGKAFALLIDGREVSKASTGERAQVANQLAMQFSGCGCPVLLDEVGALAPRVRSACISALSNVPADRTVIVATIPHDRAPNLAMLTDWLSPAGLVTAQAGILENVTTAATDAA